MVVSRDGLWLGMGGGGLAGSLVARQLVAGRVLAVLWGGGDDFIL